MASEKKLKAVKKEGGKKAQDLAGMADMGSLFQQAMLQEPAGDMELLKIALEAMNVEVDSAAEERKGGAGGVAKILISAGDDKLAVIVHVPEMFTKSDAEGNVRGYEISAADWLEAALSNLPGDGKGAEVIERSPTIASATYVNDPEHGRFVLKAKDAVSGASFAFLRSKSLVVDDDDSEEMVFGDDDMPGF
eukprot:TRINITY_DN1339_c0_g1_i2.p2 TRINITY_DN1339_c0_g1~~TRINITY_DN1339_c0_g1_i2.p2  ORF type:complete len:192 (+),score=97.00 TRINITY_DN1339_c0_g1_i2:87-662(+)